MILGERVYFAYFTADEKCVKLLNCIVTSTCENGDTYATISPVGEDKKEILIDVNKEYRPCYDSTEGVFDIWGSDMDKVIELSEKYVMRYITTKIVSLTNEITRQSDTLKRYTEDVHRYTEMLRNINIGRFPSSE